MSGETPPHHRPDGRGYLNPWPKGADPGRDRGALLRWMWERRRDGVAHDPGRDALPVVASDVAHPWAAPGEVRVTWVGHSTFLVQLPGLNLLTDPVWSRRASPVQWAGPARLVAPGLELGALPDRLHGVLLSHDHFDHLDRPTVRRLAERYGAETTWFAPLGHEGWLRRQGVDRIVELDWWQTAALKGGLGSARIDALPANHWTARSPFRSSRRLWASWGVRDADGASLYFGGDSGYFPGYGEIAERAGPFDVVLLPIGAYAPRWFMRSAHMDPAEAVQAFTDLGARGVMVGMHWGTFRLSDEDPLEPPRLARDAWRRQGLEAGRLHILRHGETLIAQTGRDGASPPRPGIGGQATPAD